MGCDRKGIQLPHDERQLSLKGCREILGSDVELSDAELTALRGELYAFADAILRIHASEIAVPCDDVLSALSPEDRADFEERAAIVEIEGKLPRVHAERFAAAALPAEQRTKAMQAVIYCRVSTAEQTQNLSLATQERLCREDAGAKGGTFHASSWSVASQPKRSNDRSS